MRKWLLDIRKNLNLSTYQAAEICGLSQSFYWAIENGKRGVCVNTAKKIAKNMNFDWQLFYQDSKKED